MFQRNLVLIWGRMLRVEVLDTLEDPQIGDK